MSVEWRRDEKIYAELVEMQERGNITKFELSENLMRRRADIAARIEAAQAAADTPESAGRAQELKSCDARLDDIAKRIDQIEVLGVEAPQELGGIQQELENLKVWSLIF